MLIGTVNIFFYFPQPFCHNKILGEHAHITKSWRDTWP